jgi:Flp pilus assembly protein TadD
MTIYNPLLLKKHDLVGGFIARQAILNRLLDDLRRESPGNTPQHQLILGQRGSGKTTLLLRLAFALEDDPDLSATWIPLIFPEEQYNVANLADFWLNCVDALSDALDRSGQTAASERLDERVEKLAAGENRTAAALKILLEEADRIGRRLLLLVDNLDIVLNRLNEREDWEFRRIISEERRLHFIGASSRALESVYEYGRAFFDFFQAHELKGFDESETFATLRHLAEASGNEKVAKLIDEQPARIKTLNVLTGGNPRTLSVLFKVLSLGPDGDVQRDIEQLLDEYTPLYKARFEELSEQGQKVVDAMAIHWDPLTAGDLTARLAPMTVNQVSAQLKRLEDFGVVEKTPWFGEKKNGYQVSERFFNIWYLMRASRRVRRKLLWLVRFLEVWYDRQELDERARGFLEKDPQAVGRERFADLALVYSQATRDPYLQRNLESAGLEAVAGLDFTDLPPELQDRKERVDLLHELCRRTCEMQRDWDGIEPREFWRLLGGSPHLSLAEKTRTVEQLPGLSVADLRELYKKLEKVERRLKQGWATRHATVEKLYEVLSTGELSGVFDFEAAVAVAKRYEKHFLPYTAFRSRVLTRVWGNGIAAEDVAEAESLFERLSREPGFESLGWLGMGAIRADNLKRYDEAESAYRRSIELDPSNDIAWHGLGVTLWNLRRYDEAERACRRAIELSPNDPDPWEALAFTLRELKRYNEAEEALRRATDLNPSDPRLWGILGDLFQYWLNDSKRAEQAYREAIALDPDEPLACVGLGNALGVLQRFDEAERAHRHAIELDTNTSDGWNGLGVALSELKRFEEAEKAYREAIRVGSTNQWAWRNLGNLLRDQERYTEMEEAYRRAIELDPNSTLIRHDFAISMHQRYRSKEAEEAYRQAIQLDPNNALQWRNLGRLLHWRFTGRDREAAEAYLRAGEFSTDAWRPDWFVRAAERADIATMVGLLQRAMKLAPENVEIQFLLVRAYTLSDKWYAAYPVLEQAVAKDESFSIPAFRDAVKTGHLADVLKIFEKTGAHERWRPLYEALQAVKAGSRDYLRRIAPEVREPALTILKELAPDLA